MPIVGRLVIDSSAAPTELCLIGAQEGTDKSPFNQAGHRHPYTPVYTMLFAGLKGRAVRFAEIGVAMGASAAMWSRYFTHPDTQIQIFDRDTSLLDQARQRVPDGRVSMGVMDVEIDGSVAAGLGEGLYDVVLDDSSHNVEHQIRIIREALPRVKPGGMLIIEDVFRNQDEEEYIKNLQAELGTCSAAYFVMCEHQLRWSPGWDNDKLLVLVKA